MSSKKGDKVERELEPLFMLRNLDKTVAPTKTSKPPGTNKSSYASSGSSHKKETSKVTGREFNASKDPGVRDDKKQSKYGYAGGSLVSRYPDVNSSKILNKYSGVGSSRIQKDDPASGQYSASRSASPANQYAASKCTYPAVSSTKFQRDVLTSGYSKPTIHPSSNALNPKSIYPSGSATKLQRDNTAGSASMPPSSAAQSRYSTLPGSSSSRSNKYDDTSKSTHGSDSRAPSFAKSVFKSAKDIEFASRQTKIDQLPPAERKEQEKWAQTQAGGIGTCPANLNWIRIKGGYMCSGEAHGVTDEDLQEGRGAIRFLEEEPTAHGGSAKYFVGPYYYDKSFGKRGIWRNAGGDTDSVVQSSSPEAYIPLLLCKGYPMITWRVHAGCVIMDSWIGAVIDRTPSLDDFEKLRVELERKAQADRTIAQQFKEAFEKSKKNVNGTGKPRCFA